MTDAFEVAVDKLCIVFWDTGGTLTRAAAARWWPQGGPVWKRVETWLRAWQDKGWVQRRELDDTWVLTEAGAAAYADYAMGGGPS